MQFWNELEGQTIDGLFPLRRLIRSEGRSAWFETETPAPQTGRATISLTEALTDADEIVARLQAAQQLKHPNLVEIGQIGQVSIDNTQVVYAVMEPIEQSLSDVLQSQPLSAEEGREVAEALVGALTAIHQGGMSHGHVEAASVLATAEKVKLRSDCLQLNPTGQAEDVAGVGSTLFHAFTQRKSANATDVQVNRIPAPFGEIVRNSMARRWSLAQIANALKPAPPVAVPPPPAPAARRVDPVPAKAPEPVTVKPPSVVETPPEPAVPKPPAPLPALPPAARPAAAATPLAEQAPLFPAAEEPAPVNHSSRPIALYAAVAVVVLAIIGWLVMRHPSEPVAPANTQSAPAASPAPAAPPPAVKPSLAMTGPSVHKPAATVTNSAGIAAAKPSNGRPIWRVIAYTYHGQTMADESVARIKGAHPDLAPEVFNPRGSDVYMVILGGPLDHPQATAMLKKARREGLPEDTFLRNFSE